MSVAFRRESDEEHLEPRFELPIPAGPNIVTPRGLRLIEERVASLEAELSAAVTDDRRTEAKRDLRYWRARLGSARIAPSPPADEAALGSRVVFRQDGRERTIDIVGEDEAEPTKGSIASSAPLAQALIGGGPGDRLEFAGKADALEIISTAPIDAH